jgi:eukaryotic-like serine/threonine-protein kinase
MISSPQPGDRVGPYRIDALLKNGGMASVYRGTDVRTGRPVAIKVPHPELEADVLFFDRFHREAEIGRKLDHPGVVKVLPDEDSGRVCMVMEWVEGRPLREILDEEKKLSPERAARIALRVCDALGYIHVHGIIHRDLKPDNVMVDEQDRIKLIDFGIAGDAAMRRLTFSRFTKAMGTPDYVSPEQVKGKRGDARSDLYSLGAMLYEMVTGEVPFGGPNALTSLNQRLLAPPPPPREIDPEISPQLEEIIFRAMERDPAHRYQHAREFAVDLEHPEKVGVEERQEARSARQAPAVARRKLNWSYVAVVLIPLVIVALLLLVAHSQ